MEGLRGFAVFLVFLVHFATLLKPWMSGGSDLLVLIESLHAIGSVGVDLFFVLSGYLIYGSLLARSQSFLSFILRRIERIYPAFLAVFVIYVVMSFLFPEESKIPDSAAEGLIYIIQNLILLPGIFKIDPMISVAWSLSYEMFYYLATPVIIILFRLRYRCFIWRTKLFLCAAFLIVVYCALYGGHARLVMFISGIVLYEVINGRRIPAPSSAIGFLALLAGLFGALIPLDGPGGSALKISVLFVSFFILCFTCLSNSSSWLPLAFSWTPLRWLGNMSYSYYLLHGLALKAGFLVFSILAPAVSHGYWLFWGLLLPMFVLTLIPTTLLFLLVERPFSLAPRRARIVPLASE